VEVTGNYQKVVILKNEAESKVQIPKDGALQMMEMSRTKLQKFLDRYSILFMGNI